MNKRGCYLILVLLILMSKIIIATNFEFKTSNDKVEIGELLGDVIAALTKTHISELKSYEIQTDEGTSNVNQYIRFKDLSNAPRISFTENEQDEVDDFLYIPSGTGSNNAFFEYEMEFEEGFISSISTDLLPDYDGEVLYILDQEYKIVESKKDGNSLKLTLASGSLIDLLPEGGTKTYTVGNTNYQIDVLTIDADKSVRFKVNGAELNKMSKGDINALQGGAFLGVSDVLISNTQAPDMVEIFIGAKVITFKDNDFTDNNFNQDVNVNKEEIENAHIKISATVTGSNLKITKILYRFSAQINIYIKENEKLTSHIADPKGLLGNWDIKYSGLNIPSHNEIKFNPIANSEYNLIFKNKAGDSITVPFISNKVSFKLGDDDQDLLVQEGSSSSFNVDKNDFFILTSSNTKTGSTYILKYDSIDTNTNITYFTDLGTNSQKSAPLTMNQSGMYGEGTLSAGTMQAKIFVDDAANNPIAVDLNGDNSPDGSTVVDIVTAGGGILDLTTLSGSTYTINLKTDASEFEENVTADENIQFTIEARSGNKIGIQSTFSGISTGTITDHILGLSNYGVQMDILKTTAADVAETLTFKYPADQAFGNVFIETSQEQTVTVSSQQTQSSCTNGILDGDETGIDCGGSCPQCQVQAAPTCSDGLQNQNETGIDCGGPCQPCQQIISTGCPNGCPYTNEKGENLCLNIGTRIGALFCDSDKLMKAQKDMSENCSNAYECKINICENNKCGKHITLLTIIINLLILVGLGALIYYIITLFKCHEKK